MKMIPNMVVKERVRDYVTTFPKNQWQECDLYVCVVLGIKPRALNMLGKQLYL
jgi:hypothetical protein